MPTRNAAPDQCRVSLRLTRRNVRVGRWDSERWHVVALGTCTLPEGEAPQRVRSWENAEGEEHLWDGLTLALYPDETAHYAHNLAGQQPVLFVVCAQDEAHGGMRPVLLTLSQDEAVSHMEVDDEVLALPLPREISEWVSAYIERVGIKREPRRKRANHG